MASKRNVIDFEDEPALVQLVEDVSESREPVVLRRNGEDVAVIAPFEAPSGNGPNGRMLILINSSKRLTNST